MTKEPFIDLSLHAEFLEMGALRKGVPGAGDRIDAWFEAVWRSLRAGYEKAVISVRFWAFTDAEHPEWGTPWAHTRTMPDDMPANAVRP